LKKKISLAIVILSVITFFIAILYYQVPLKTLFTTNPILIIFLSISTLFGGVSFVWDKLFPPSKKIIDQIKEQTEHLVSVQTGGDTFIYLMLYHFDVNRNIARQIVIEKKGQYSIYDATFRVSDIKTNKNVLIQKLDNFSAPAVMLKGPWSLSDDIYYRIFFHARNGQWTQDLIMKKSLEDGYWPVCTRVHNNKGEIIHEEIDDKFIARFGSPVWSS